MIPVRYEILRRGRVVDTAESFVGASRRAAYLSARNLTEHTIRPAYTTHHGPWCDEEPEGSCSTCREPFAA